MKFTRNARKLIAAVALTGAAIALPAVALAAPGASGSAGAAAAGAEIHPQKVIADDRSNSVVIVATEPVYLHILDLIRRLDLPQSG